jgi:hypothetical protein
MSVQAAPGAVAVPAANGTGSVLCSWDAPETVNLNPSPPSGTNRIDLIVCQSHGQDIDGGTVDDFVITFVAGAEAATPTPPAVPPGAAALAQVMINGGAAAVAAADITDTRPGNLAVGASFAPVRYSATQSPAQSMPRAAWTTVTAWAAPSEDVGGITVAGGAFRVPIAGRYLVVASCIWGLPGSTTGLMQQQQSSSRAGASAGMTHVWLSAATGNIMMPPSVKMASLQAGDTVGVQLYNGHPSAAVNTFGGYGGIQIERIG